MPSVRAPAALLRSIRGQGQGRSRTGSGSVAPFGPFGLSGPSGPCRQRPQQPVASFRQPRRPIFIGGGVTRNKYRARPVTATRCRPASGGPGERTRSGSLRSRQGGGGAATPTAASTNGPSRASAGRANKSERPQQAAARRRHLSWRLHLHRSPCRCQQQAACQISDMSSRAPSRPGAKTNWLANCLPYFIRFDFHFNFHYGYCWPPPFQLPPASIYTM